MAATMMLQWWLTYAGASISMYRIHSGKNPDCLHNSAGNLRSLLCIRWYLKKRNKQDTTSLHAAITEQSSKQDIGLLTYVVGKQEPSNWVLFAPCRLAWIPFLASQLMTYNVSLPWSCCFLRHLLSFSTTYFIAQQKPWHFIPGGARPCRLPCVNFYPL